MLTKIAITGFVTLTLLMALILRKGFLVVSVDESAPEVHHVHIWLPATLVSTVLAFTPDKHLRDAAAKAGPWLEVAHSSCDQLERTPDFTLADVTDPSGHVTVQKRGGNIEVTVDKPGQKVFVAVPLVALEDVTDRLQEARPTL